MDRISKHLTKCGLDSIKPAAIGIYNAKCHSRIDQEIVASRIDLSKNRYFMSGRPSCGLFYISVDFCLVAACSV
jgi:hypothetical protein